MTLPGKLIIGFLQEDNPVKSFFRVKPLAAGEDTGTLEPIEDIKQLYPDDGFIRIVPDKNEITQFKNRMRQMGRYCALDLRAHPGETDKIRPNKNYAPAGAERNNHIVYSDVIDAMLPEMAAEVVTPRACSPPIRWNCARARPARPLCWCGANLRCRGPGYGRTARRVAA